MTVPTAYCRVRVRDAQERMESQTGRRRQEPNTTVLITVFEPTAGDREACNAA
jgi:hypothetical protein